MPFDDPGVGTPFESPIEDGTFSVFCLGTTDGENYGNGPTMRWDFYVYDRSATEQVMREDGEPYVVSVLSGTKITKSEKGNSKPYDWATALIGEPIDDLTGPEVAAGIRDKWALATIIHNAKGWPQIPADGLKPWTEPKQRAAAPAAPKAARPAPASPAQPATAAATATATYVAEDGDAEPFD
jgi:hypothetical protein